MEPPKPRARMTIHELYPDLTEEQLKEVEEALRNYAALAWRVFERLEREKSEGFDDGKNRP
jgi:hypothetical protein